MSSQLTLAQQCDLGYLDDILQRNGYVIFICGAKEKGKTNLALFLDEYSYDKGYKDRIATNIWTENYRIEKQITDLETLEEWLKEKGKKLFDLDELGKHARKMGFMTKKNIAIMDIIQLIWHYDAGFIGCAPSESFIDNNFLNTDILDAKIRKITQTSALVFDYLRNESYFLHDIPPTSIKYNRKDIAKFDLKKKIDLDSLRKCCQVAMVYAETESYKETSKRFNPPLHDEQIKRFLIEHLKHTAHDSHNNERNITT
jgi:hypothetical protein